MTKPKAELFDIGSIDTVAASDAGTEVELLHPTTRKPLGVFISILGKHSNTFREIVRERINRRAAAEQRAARRNKPLEPRTAEEIEREGLELLAACSTGWRSETRDEKGDVVANETVMVFKGEKLPFSTANALKVYTEMLWVREQIDEAIGDIENFIQA